MADALRGLRGTATLSLSRSSGRRIRVDPGGQVDVPSRSGDYRESRAGSALLLALPPGGRPGRGNAHDAATGMTNCCARVAPAFTFSVRWHRSWTS
jgi:hypothetical protein